MATRINQEILDLIEILEALYFLTQSLEGDALEQVKTFRERYHALNRQGRFELRNSIRKDIKRLRTHYGAIPTNKTFVKYLNDARRQLGYAYLPKLTITRHLFKHYEKVFPRWPHIPDHAFVIFDGQTNARMLQIWVSEQMFFADAARLIEDARPLHGGIPTQRFRERPKNKQRAMQTMLRAAVLATFQSLEAYLGGLAYGCFYAHDDRLRLKDHDLLVEWNSQTKRRQFVAFDKNGKVVRTNPPFGTNSQLVLERESSLWLTGSRSGRIPSRQRLRLPMSLMWECFSRSRRIASESRPPGDDSSAD